MTAIVNSAKNQSEFLAITVTFSKAREKSRIQSAIGFGFASHWLVARDFQANHKLPSNRKRNYFDRHLKTALYNNRIQELYKLLLAFCERGKEEHPKKKKKKLWEN